MISALEIGFALSASLLLLVHVLKNQPKPKPVRIRAQDRIGHAQRRRGPHA